MLCIVTFVYTEWIELTRWMAGKWYLADVGNIHYCMVNTLSRHFMWSPLMEGNHFAYHFTPLLVLLSPITLLSRYAVPLVTFYVLALALCPAAVFGLARSRGVPAAAAVALSFLFVANHFLGSLQLANHFEIFFVLFFIVCMASHPGSKMFWASAVLALMVKEDAAVWIGAYAVLEWWLRRRSGDSRPFGVLTMMCVVYFAAAAAVMWTISRMQGVGAEVYAKRAGGVGMGMDSVQVAFLLVASFAFLPLLAGWRTLLLLLPAPLLIVNFEFIRHLLYYYSYPFLPYLSLTACIGLARVCTWLGERKASSVVPTAALTICAAAQAILPTRTDSYRRVPVVVSARDTYRMEIASSLLPRDACAVIQFGLWGITPDVRDAKMLTTKNITPDSYVFLDLKAPYGMETAKFVELARAVMDDVEAKRRPLLHSRYDLFLVGPATQGATR